MTQAPHLELLELPDRSAWRAWLEANHDTSPGAWLAVGKNGGARTALTYEDAVQEALCFGWIDSTTHRLDADRAAAQHFDGFPASARKAALYWIASAKRADTRAKRIARVVGLAAEGRRPA